jgi:DNA helicase HerA-like ATPase
LSGGSDPSIRLGTTEQGQPVALALDKVWQHGLTLGASGAGKSYTALWIILSALRIISQVLDDSSHTSFPAFAVLDAKGELFERTIRYIYAFLYHLRPEAREALKKKLVTINFSGSDITPYNILARREGLADELMVADRIDTISEQFSGLSEMSVRMKLIAKYFFLLMSEFEIPLPFFERLCTDPVLLDGLAEKSKNPQVRDYFKHRFADESESTFLALRQRIDSLLVSEGVRLSLSASSAPDFASLQDQGCIFLINTAGRNITRGISELLQGLILSDIKQSIFRRTNYDQKVLIFMDEAQNLFKSSVNREHMVDLLTMSRSFGSFVVLITQSLTSAVRDSDVLNSIMSNVRWVVMLRSTPRDAELIAPALPLSSTQSKPRQHPLEPSKHMSGSEELRMRLKEIPKLPDRQAYLWLKAYMHTAVKITTPRVPSPLEIVGCTQDEFDDFVSSVRIGQGIPKETIRKEIEQRERRLREMLRPQRSHTHPALREGTQTLIKTLEEEYGKKK